jgi:hypothetical protein
MMIRSVFLLFIFFTSSVNAQQISFMSDQYETAKAVTDFTKAELSSMLAGKINHHTILFELKKDATLTNGSFAFDIKKKDQIFNVVLSGEGETEILHAAHSFLEHIGFQFDMFNSIIPDQINISTIRTGYFLVNPYTRWRGIRQHVNFPMDISSYPLEEAKEYLNNLMRLRFNKLAVHSYPNLWHEVYTGDSTEYAGNFFYNRPHEIPDVPVISKHIRHNNKLFAIPAIEPFYADNKIRSKMATDWMRSLLTYAKSIGFKIHFSIEPRAKGDIQYIIDNCKSALTNYPMIDELEINTEELGGWGNSCTDTTVKAILIKWFGEGVLRDTMVSGHITKNQTDLDNLINQIGRNITAVKILQQEKWFTNNGISPKIGIYCTIAPYAAAAYHLVRKFAPDVEVSIMPGHGSMRTAKHFSSIPKTSQDLQMTTLFSWIEFDGLMFTQQNPVEGIDAIWQQLDSIKGNHQVHAILFNHWRTAENSLATRYAAVTAIKGPVKRAGFYREFAVQKNIPDPNSFAWCMEKLEWIDAYSTNELPNYGFCWLGAWTNGGPYTWISRKNLNLVKNTYDSIHNSLKELMKKATSEVAMIELSLLINRVEASLAYNEAFDWACRVQELKKDDKGFYPEVEKVKAANFFTNSLNAYYRYMDIHSKIMPDRGTEGTLINLWHGPIYGLKVLRERITGIPVNQPFSPEKQGEGPPLPILLKNRQ